MTAAVVAISENIFRDGLEDQAVSDHDIIPRAVTAVAHPSLTAEAICLYWEDFRRAVRDRGELVGGTADPGDFYEPGDCVTRDDAVDLKCADADDAFRTIMRGVRQ